MREIKEAGEIVAVETEGWEWLPDTCVGHLVWGLSHRKRQP
jgi:hypothetical protein